MLIRKLSEIEGTEKDVFWGNGKSRRLLVGGDGMPYSLTDTIIDAGTSSLLEYKNHIESCYCIEGHGEVEDMEGNIYPIEVGTVYALDKNDAHYLRAITRMRLICVFLPALQGTETHSLDNNGSSSY
jgi:L-ectoine synthase